MLDEFFEKWKLILYRLSVRIFSYTKNCNKNYSSTEIKQKNFFFLNVFYRRYNGFYRMPLLNGFYQTVVEQLLKMLFLPVCDWLASSIGGEHLGKVWGQELSCVRRLRCRPSGCFWRHRSHGAICFLFAVSFSHPSNRVAAPVCFLPHADILFARCFFCLWQLVKINGNCPEKSI